jgi:hypothetical protein
MCGWFISSRQMRSLWGERIMSEANLHLKQDLEQRVRLRTGHRIHDLAIELRPERVILGGRSSTYYLKQLAQHGVREVLPYISLENAIVVDDPLQSAEECASRPTDDATIAGGEDSTHPTFKAAARL